MSLDEAHAHGAQPPDRLLVSLVDEVRHEVVGRAKLIHVVPRESKERLGELRHPVCTQHPDASHARLEVTHPEDQRRSTQVLDCVGNARHAPRALYSPQRGSASRRAHLGNISFAQEAGNVGRVLRRCGAYRYARYRALREVYSAVHSTLRMFEGRGESFSM